MTNIFIVPLVSSQSCHDKLIELFSEKLYLIGLAALVVAVIMVSVGVFYTLKLLILLPIIMTQIVENRRLELSCCVLFPLLDLRDDFHHGALLWDPQQPSILKVQIMRNNGPHQSVMTLFYFVLLQSFLLWLENSKNDYLSFYFRLENATR